MVKVLRLDVPLGDVKPDARPVVFVGPFEHHSNLLPWRESSADVVMVRENENGGVDLDHLTSVLKEYAKRPLKIGSFSAASNVTGMLAEVDKITVLLHEHNALAFWDYAAAGPYAQINMNPVMPSDQSMGSGAGGVSADVRALLYKDAVFLSPHKFIGGPGASGVLIAKKRLFANAVPSNPGGGTVFFVTGQDHRYLSNREEREEGGTPDIIGSVRAGLVLHLKRAVGAHTIESIEAKYTAMAIKALSAHPNIRLLGSLEAARLPIFSFLIRCPALASKLSGPEQLSCRFLHFNFVCALLNDLFGVQVCDLPPPPPPPPLPPLLSLSSLLFPHPSHSVSAEAAANVPVRTPLIF
jgi:selenocysteine lyase/cysteine desulfurase